MKKNIILVFLVILFIPFSGYTQSNSEKTNTTTYILIRHSEKNLSDTTNKNPNLTEKGTKRSENIARTLINVPIDYVFSTNYNRTLQTAAPISKSKNVETLLYNPKDLYNEEFKKLTKGKTTVIVGHSNTTPKFVNKIIKEDKYQNLDEKEYSKLFIIKITQNIITDMVLHIE